MHLPRKIVAIGIKVTVHIHNKLVFKYPGTFISSRMITDGFDQMETSAPNVQSVIRQTS